MARVIHVCRVQDVIPVSANTFEIELQSSSGAVLNYHAGQYLSLELDINRDGQPQSLFYTIANGFNPEQPRRLQLLIQNNSEWSGKIVNHLFELAGSDSVVNVTLPMGQAYLQTDLTFPHLLIAAGSGISKIKCLTEAILRQRPDAEVSVYWTNTNSDDFYLLEQFQRWVTQNKNFNFTPVLESPAKGWSGRSGYLYKVIKEDFSDLKGVQTYLCGSPNMVYGTVDQLTFIGLSEKDCYSDVFEFAPRQ